MTNMTKIHMNFMVNSENFCLPSYSFETVRWKLAKNADISEIMPATV